MCTVPTKSWDFRHLLQIVYFCLQHPIIERLQPDASGNRAEHGRQVDQEGQLHRQAEQQDQVPGTRD